MATRKKYLFRSPYTKNPTRKSWIFSFVPTGTTSFDLRSTSFRAKREHHYSFSVQMSEVEALPQMMLQQVAKDVMLRINDVALRANEVLSVCLDC